MNLGWMYEHGVGVPRDFRLAKRHYDLALEMNSEAYIPIIFEPYALAKSKMVSSTFPARPSRSRKILDENYGRKDLEYERRMKEVFESLQVDLRKRYGMYEERIFGELVAMIGESGGEEDHLLQQRATVLSKDTVEPFEAHDKIHWQSQDQAVECPKCFDRIFVPLLAENDNGYLQQNLKLTCRKCSHLVTKLTLAVHKLVTNLVVGNVTLSQTLHYSGAAALSDPIRANQVKTAVLRSDVFIPRRDDLSPQERAVDIQEAVEYDMAKLKQHMGVYMKDGGSKLYGESFSLWNANTEPKQAEQDRSFTGKMRKYGWSEPNFFARPGDEVALNHCIVFQPDVKQAKGLLCTYVRYRSRLAHPPTLPSYNNDCLRELSEDRKVIIAGRDESRRTALEDEEESEEEESDEETKPGQLKESD
ncbi:hypothetical protein F5146DRAFT_1006758 [Armillaria mellea]|nr:hypothetical protein F5146DRAFT_1006758 [Armillaria mellea]